MLNRRTLATLRRIGASVDEIQDAGKALMEEAPLAAIGYFAAQDRLIAQLLRTAVQHARQRGYSWTVIGKALGVPPHTARRRYPDA